MQFCMDSYIRGYHVYEETWTTTFAEQLYAKENTAIVEESDVELDVIEIKQGPSTTGRTADLS